MSNIIRKFHPGVYIREILEEYQMSQHEFAMRLDMDDKRMSKIMNGQSKLTTEDAIKLSKLLDMSAETWLNLQNAYDIYKLELEKEKNKKNQIEIFKMIDHSFLKLTGLVTNDINIEQKIDELKKNLFISNLETLRKIDFFTFFRSTNHELIEKTVILRNIWIAAALAEARKIEVSKFNEELLKQRLQDIRKMTLKMPDSFQNELEQIMKDCGIKLVILPYLKSSNIHGMTRWIDNDTVILAINVRGKDADKFWFTLFHEIGHIFQKSKREMIVTNNEAEMDADNFAGAILIPEKDYEQFKKGILTESSIKEFAKKLQIHPGIVVGRLQHDRILSYHEYHYLKDQYVFNFPSFQN